jgi:hypothetical protein
MFLFFLNLIQIQTTHWDIFSKLQIRIAPFFFVKMISGNAVQDSRYKIQDSRYKIQDTRYKIHVLHLLHLLLLPLSSCSCATILQANLTRSVTLVEAREYGSCRGAEGELRVSAATPSKRKAVG